MEGKIMNFRMGRHHKYTNQMIIEVSGVDNQDKAADLRGKKVIFTTDSGKELKGRVSNPHGTNGAVRAIFDTGMPGQAVGKKVKIE